MSTVNHMLGLKNPLNKDYPFYALIEVASNTEGKTDNERLFSLLGDSENIIMVRIVVIKDLRTVLLLKMRDRVNISGKSEKK